MTPQQYREALASLGLSQIAAAKLFQTDPRTSRRWAAKGAPPAVAIVLRLLVAGTITIQDIEDARQ